MASPLCPRGFFNVFLIPHEPDKVSPSKVLLQPHFLSLLLFLKDLQWPTSNEVQEVTESE